MSTRTHIVSYEEPPEGFPGSQLKRNLAIWVVGLIAATACLLVGWMALSAGMIPPKAMTLTAIGETSVRIGIYFSQHHQLPPNLSVIPIRENYASRTTDSSGRPLVYTSDSTDSFTLRSRGDGNDGEGAMTRRFRIVDGAVQPVQ